MRCSTYRRRIYFRPCNFLLIQITFSSPFKDTHMSRCPDREAMLKLTNYQGRRTIYPGRWTIIRDCFYILYRFSDINTTLIFFKRRKEKVNLKSLLFAKNWGSNRTFYPQQRDSISIFFQKFKMPASSVQIFLFFSDYFVIFN